MAAVRIWMITLTAPTGEHAQEKIGAGSFLGAVRKVVDEKGAALVGPQEPGVSVACAVRGYRVNEDGDPVRGVQYATATIETYTAIRFDVVGIDKAPTSPCWRAA